MTIDIKLLLAGHPFLFDEWESSIKGFYGCSILAAILSSTGIFYPPAHRESALQQVTQRKNYPADIVTGIAEINIHIIPHLSGNFKEMYTPKCLKSLISFHGGFILKPDGGFGGIYGIKNKSERTRYYAGKTTRSMVL